jgi:hypothetical protein
MVMRAFLRIEVRTFRCARVLVAATLIACGTTGAIPYAQGRGGSVPAPPRDAAAAVPEPVGSALLAGVVASADGGRPVRRATVRLVPVSGGPANIRPVINGVPANGSLTATTDDEGAFRFEQIPAGQYTLSAGKAGYLTAAYGQKRPGTGTPGTPISLAAGQRLDKLWIVMPRGSVLAGTVADDAGEPAYGVQVRAFKYVMRGGARVLEQAGIAVSDDRGAYRIPVLSPGDYVIVATPRDDTMVFGDMLSLVNMRAVEAVRVSGGMSEQFIVRAAPNAERSADPAPTSGYAPVYYPGTTLAPAAAPVELGLSEERLGLDLRLELVPLGRITGIVTAPDGRSLTGVEVLLEDATESLPGIGNRSVRVLADGSFVLNGVAPGTYKITARSGGRVQVMMGATGAGAVRVTRTLDAARGPGPFAGTMEAGPPEESPLWAYAEATIGDGRTPVSLMLALQPALTLTGRIEFAGTRVPPEDLSSVRIGLTPAVNVRPGDSAVGQFTDGRTFTVPGIVPGTYRPVILGLAGWVPKSFDVNGRDALDSPLDVVDRDVAGGVLTMVEALGTLSGTLQDSSGRPTANYMVIIAPADPRFWTPQSRRIQAARPATDGRFGFRNLPAGDYRLVALDDVEPESWFDPEFLRQLVPASIAVTLTDGQTTVQDVRISR